MTFKVIIFISIINFIVADNEPIQNKVIASKEKLSSPENINNQLNKSNTFSPADIGPEVVLPENNQELNNLPGYLDTQDIGNVKEYFYVLTSISLLVICLIVFRAMRSVFIIILFVTAT